MLIACLLVASGFFIENQSELNLENLSNSSYKSLYLQAGGNFD